MNSTAARIGALAALALAASATAAVAQAIGEEPPLATQPPPFEEPAPEPPTPEPPPPLIPPTPVAPTPAVTAAPLGGLDFFQAGAGQTGLSPTLWRGTSAALMQDVLSRLGDKPLSPAARAAALGALRTSAAAPDGAGSDPALAAARVRALLQLGDPEGVDAVLDRTSGVAASAGLSEAHAEANLYLGRDEDACRIGQDSREGRDQAFFVRLRAYCDALADRGAQAQLGLTLLEQGGGKDAAYGRLMNALLAGGAGTPPAASLQTGLHTALSRRLGLDLAPALEKASPAAVAVLAAPGAPEETRPAALVRAEALGLAEIEAPTLAAADEVGAALVEAIGGLRGEAAPSSEIVDRLVRLAAADPKAKSRAQGAVLLLAAAGAEVPAEHRAALLRFETPAGDASAARRLALALAAEGGRPGETALVALDIALSSGAGGAKLADRVEIVRALRRAGAPFWRDWALEGLYALAAAPQR